MDFQSITVILAAVGGVILLFIIISGIFRLYKVVPPNQAMVVSGRKGFRIVKGGGSIVWPYVEKMFYLSLELMTIPVDVKRVYTEEGVPVNVNGVTQVKIGGDEASIRTAAEQLLGKSQEEIHNAALQTLEGHIRAILGTLTIEKIYKDRDAFAQSVQSLATSDMAGMGFVIVSFTIKDIDDDQKYLDSLGRKRTAEVIRDAEIGEAEAKRQSRIKVVEAEQAAREAEFAAQTKIAEAEKTRNVQVAIYQAESSTQKAKADIAYDIQEAEQKRILAEKLGAAEVERRRQEALAAAQAIAVAEQMKQAEVFVPSEVEKRAAIERASGEAEAVRLRAAAEADRVRLTRVAEADGNKAVRLAEATAIEATGRAQAEAQRAQLLAQAEGERQLAEARSAQDSVNFRLQVAEILTKAQVSIAAELAHAFQGIGENVRVVQFSGGDPTEGNALFKMLTQSGPEALIKLNETVRTLTGHDIESLLKRVTEIASDRSGKAASEKGKRVGSVPA